MADPRVPRSRLSKWLSYVRSSRFLGLMQTVGILGAFIVAIMASRLDERRTAATIMFEFDKMLNTAPRKGIIQAAERGECLLKQNQGRFTEEDLDKLFDVYDLISVAYDSSLMPKTMLVEEFGYGFEKIYRSAEVQDYLKGVRVQPDTEMWASLDDLARDIGVSAEPVFRACKPAQVRASSEPQT
jgi:hypothetical protein